MKETNEIIQRRSLFDSALLLFETQMLSVTLLAPFASLAFPLDARFWAVISGIGLIAAMLLEIRLRRPQFSLVPARVQAAPVRASIDARGLKPAHVYGI